jgi:hypothetical protein
LAFRTSGTRSSAEEVWGSKPTRSAKVVAARARLNLALSGKSVIITLSFNDSDPKLGKNLDPNQYAKVRRIEVLNQVRFADPFTVIVSWLPIKAARFAHPKFPANLHNRSTAMNR